MHSQGQRAWQKIGLLRVEPNVFRRVWLQPAKLRLERFALPYITFAWRMESRCVAINVSIHDSFRGDEDLVTGIWAYYLGSRYSIGTTYSQRHHHDEEFGDVLSYHHRKPTGEEIPDPSGYPSWVHLVTAMFKATGSCCAWSSSHSKCLSCEVMPLVSLVFFSGFYIGMTHTQWTPEFHSVQVFGFSYGWVPTTSAACRSLHWVKVKWVMLENHMQVGNECEIHVLSCFHWFSF